MLDGGRALHWHAHHPIPQGNHDTQSVHSNDPSQVPPMCIYTSNPIPVSSSPDDIPFHIRASAHTHVSKQAPCCTRGGCKGCLHHVVCVSVLCTMNPPPVCIKSWVLLHLFAFLNLDGQEYVVDQVGVETCPSIHPHLHAPLSQISASNWKHPLVNWWFTPFSISPTHPPTLPPSLPTTHGAGPSAAQPRDRIGSGLSVRGPVALAKTMPSNPIQSLHFVLPPSLPPPSLLPPPSSLLPSILPAPLPLPTSDLRCKANQDSDEWMYALEGGKGPMVTTCDAVSRFFEHVAGGRRRRRGAAAGALQFFDLGKIKID